MPILGMRAREVWLKNMTGLRFMLVMEKPVKPGKTGLDHLLKTGMSILKINNFLNEFLYLTLYSGLAIRMTDPLYVSPSLNETLLNDVAFPQSLPSLVASHVLKPTENDRILDMCAAPGGKATHLATLMRNKVSMVILKLK